MGKAPKQNKAGPVIAEKSSPVPQTSKNGISTADSLSVKKELIEEHLPPIGLVFTVILCSGFLLMFGFRDVFATGRNIGGEMDDAYLQFTKSHVFFDDSRGWKSQQGGLSTIQPVTTDANNMGGLFVRKLGGAAFLALQFQKLMPVLIHPWAARWKQGHFRPVFWTAVAANVLLSSFYVSKLPDLTAAGADGLPKIFLVVLAIESMVILSYLYSSRKVKKGAAIAMTDEGTVEAEENGILAGLYVGDKFVSQFLAINLLLLCLFKFVAGFFIRYGSDGSGEVKARMIWKGQFFANGLILLLFRLFTQAAKSASLDLRWHLMFIAYETGIFLLYGFL